MMTIDQLSKKRKNLRQQLTENNSMEGVKELLTLLYSDKVHFIYELLQNAEDVGATEVTFTLNTNNLEFEHNGPRLFSIEDVDSITNFGKSAKAKADDVTSIGKFGIGFKAVFAYTATPEIESGAFHFRIHDMFVPDAEGFDPGALGERRTRFIFPFNNPKMPPEKARAEIETKLQNLNENTLLFLSNIRRVNYRLPDSAEGYLELIESENDENRVEISVKHPKNDKCSRSYYLRFEKNVSIIDEADTKPQDHRIVVAYGLKQQDKEWKIIPLDGQVCIYFPAVKETSKLRFHLHAPFASTVARDSVRECFANDKLRDHLAQLIAASMSSIRDRNLLNVEFLSILPNNKDNLSSFYLPIQKCLIEEFNKVKLTPMRQDVHAPASGSYRTTTGERSLSDLIRDEDLATLLEKNNLPPLWIANPPQINQREDNFLSMLNISEWTVKNLVEVLKTQSETVVKWLKQKCDEWHQELYAFLADTDSESDLSDIPIVRCNDGVYRVGSECHFSGDELQLDKDFFTPSVAVNEEPVLELDEEETQEENFHYVSHAVYSSRNNKDQQKARKFLETIGVEDDTETERVKAILKQRYKHGTIELREPHHKQDLEKFIGLVKVEPHKANLFKKYYIFELETEDGKRTWWFPDKTYLDTPYLATDLKTYYEILDENSDKRKFVLSPKYEKFGINLEELVAFARAIGVQTKLEIDDLKQNIPVDHPDKAYLIDEAKGQWRYNTGKDEDYFIPELEKLLDDPLVEKSRFIWLTMLHLPEQCLQARFWNNNTYRDRPPRKSSLVHALLREKWVPQQDNETTTFVHPCDASREKLPVEGFPWPEGHPKDAGEKWLNAIEFGQTIKKQKEDYAEHDQQARKEGFDSLEQKKKVIEFIQDLEQEGRSIEDIISEDRQRSERSDFPSTPVDDSVQLKKRIARELKNAPKKKREPAELKVRTINTRPWLIEQYTNDSGEMYCQICDEIMPFKKRDGEYYFEAVEALIEFPKEHVAQSLALCPVCSAKYQCFVTTDLEAMTKLKISLMNSNPDVLEIPVCLEEIHPSITEEINIRFVEVHLHELKEILYYYASRDEDENSTD